MASEIKDEGLWDANDVASFLKVDKETVYRWAKAGTIPSVRIGSTIRFRPSEIRAAGDAAGEAA